MNFRKSEVAVALVVLASSVFVRQAAAQAPVWRRLSPESPPPAARRGASAAADAAAEKIILFGGKKDEDFFNDVWQVTMGENPAWKRITPAGPAPDGRSGHTAVYDAISSRMVIFGGEGPDCSNDAWVLSNANSLNGAPGWDRLFAAGVAPAPRSHHTAVYDSGSNRMIVFGGSDCRSGAYNDVWVLVNASGLNGGAYWEQLAPTGVAPDARSGHQAIYDPGSNRMTIFGGQSNDVWVLSNANGLGGIPTWFRLRAYGTPPPAGLSAAEFFDASDNEMVVVTGRSRSSTHSDVWTLSNPYGLGGPSVWTHHSAGPASRARETEIVQNTSKPTPLSESDIPIRRGAATAYSRAGQVILFGGSDSGGAYHNDTWMLDGIRRAPDPAATAVGPIITLNSLTAPTTVTVPFNINLSLTNTGDTTSTTFTVNLYFSPTSTFSLSTAVDTGWVCNIGSLAPGGGWTCSGGIAPPPVSPGTWYFFAYAGVYNKPSRASDSGPVAVPTVTINPGCSPNPPAFRYVVGASLPGSQTCSVSTAPAGVSLLLGSVSTSSGGNWLSASFSSILVNATAPLTVSVNSSVVTSLAPGNYSGSIAIFAPGAPGGININVTLSIVPTLSVNCSGLSFSYVLGLTPPPNQTCSVTSTPSGLPVNISFSTSSGGNWLSASLSPATTPSTLTVSIVNLGNLNTGAFKGDVFLSAINVPRIDVSITFVVTRPTISATCSDLAFAYNIGLPGPPSQTCSVTTVPTGLAVISSVNTSSGGSWLGASLVPSTTPSNLSVSITNLANLAAAGPATYTGSIDLSFPNATSVSINVKLFVSQSSISSTCSSLSFTYTLGGSPPAAQTCAVGSTPTGLSVSSAVTPANSWLSAAPNPGAAPFTLTVSVNVASLNTATVLHGNITLSASGVSQINIPVTLTVLTGLSISPTSNTFTSAGGTGSTTVTLNPATATDSWSVVSNNPTWITITSPANGKGSGSGVPIGYAVAVNTGAARSGSFNVLNNAGFAAATFNISQQAPNCSAQTLSRTSFVFGSAGGTGVVNLNIPGCPLTSAVSNAGFVTASISNGAVSFSVQSDLGADRSALITINGNLTVNITQKGLVCSYSIDSHPGTSSTYPAAGGAGTIDVSGPTGCPMPTVSPSNPFVTIASVSPPTGSPLPPAGGSVNYTIAPTAASRSGSISVGSLIYLITQTTAVGYVCNVSALTIPVLRQEGVTELTGDLQIACSGSSSPGTTADFVVTFNTFVTNQPVSTDPTGQTLDAVLIKDESSGQPLALGVNAFEGLISGPNGIRFRSVPLTSGIFTLHITDMRVDATSAGASGTISATVSSPSAGAPLSFKCVPSLQCTESAQSVTQNVGRASPSSTFTIPSSTQGPISSTTYQPVTFAENLSNNQVNAYRPLQGENGNQYPALGSQIGLASNGTRFLVTLSSVPSGVAVYAPLAPTSGFGAQLMSANSTGSNGFPLLGSVTIRGTTLPGYQPITLSNGGGTATWEVTAADSHAIDTFTFNLLIDNPNNVSLANMTITQALAPLEPIRTASATASVPRFASSKGALNGCTPGVLTSGVVCLSLSPSPASLGLGAPTAPGIRSPLDGEAPANPRVTETLGSGPLDDLRLALPLSMPSLGDPATGVNVDLVTDSPNVQFIDCLSIDDGTCNPNPGGGDGISVSYNGISSGEQRIIVVLAKASSSTYSGAVNVNGSVTTTNGNSDPDATFRSNVVVPALGVTQTVTSVTPAGPIVPGSNVTETIMVTNAAAGAASLPGGLIQLTEVVPAGTSSISVGMSGTGWQCANADLATKLCTYTATLTGGQSAPPVTLTFQAPPTAPASTTLSNKVVLNLSKYQLQSHTLAWTPVTVQTTPPGLQFSADAGAAQTAPVTFYLTQDTPGSQPHTVSVQTTQTLAGTQYTFTGWSDGITTASRSIAVGTAPTSYTAVFTAQASLKISKSHSGNFTQGQQGATYTVTVSNAAGAGPSSGTVTVTETAPAGLALVSMAGQGWTCPIGNSCTRADALAAGQAYPPITVTVNVDPNAPSSVTNRVTVTGGASASDPTTILTGGNRCDVNGDGQVAISDVQSLINMVLGTAQSTPAGDLNRDGRVDVSDVQILVNVLLGSATCPN